MNVSRAVAVREGIIVSKADTEDRQGEKQTQQICIESSTVIELVLYCASVMMLRNV